MSAACRRIVGAVQGALKIIAVLVIGVTGGCSKSEHPPARGEYSLDWHPKSGTDYGNIVPGFKTLQMCRAAGSSLTHAYSRIEGGEPADGAWFDCGTNCRTVNDQSITQVCDQIVSVVPFPPFALRGDHRV